MRAGERIAVVSHSHPSVTKGGGEIVAYNLFRGLQDLGHPAVFIAACPSDKKSAVYLDDRDEDVVIFEPQEYSSFYHIAHPDFTARVISKLRDANCSVASFHHFYHVGLNTIREAARGGVRSYLTLHEYLAICNHYGQMVTRPDLHLCNRAQPAKCHRCFPETVPQQFEQRRDWFLESLGQVDRFISPSEFLKRRYVEWGLDGSRIAVLENGLPKGDFAATSSIGAVPVSASEWVFGYFGQISMFKGLDVLIECAYLLKAKSRIAPIKIRLHGPLVGLSADLRTKFMEACALGLLDYHGPYDNADVRERMQACDYVIMPSMWWENSPVVIQEAYAAGRPVIASGIGGMAEKVKDGETGLHVRAGSAIDLANTIVAAATVDMAKRLRRNIVMPPDYLDMTRSYLALFAEVDAERAGTVEA